MQCKVTEEGKDRLQTLEIRLKCPAAELPVLVAGLRRFGVNRIIDKGLLSVATVTGLDDAIDDATDATA